jgi:methyl-accepting chemotaxis protein
MLRNRRMGIGAKLTVTISLVAVLTVAAMVLLIGMRVNSMARSNALELAGETAARFGNEVKAHLEEALDEARALGKVFEAAGVLGNLDLSRRQTNAIMEYFIEHSPAFLGVYVAFEPNAFDGKDERFIDEWGHDLTGRFIPYWSWTQEGGSILEPLVDYDKPGTGDYYLVPKRTKNETIVNPRLYAVAGQLELITSLVVPITDKDGSFIGITGIDVRVSGIQDIVGEASLMKNGELTLYAADGTIAGSRDATLVGKNAVEVVQDQAFLERIVRPDGAPAEAFVVEHTLSSGTRVFSIGRPIPIGNTGKSWLVVAEVPRAEVLAPVTAISYIIALVGVIAVGLFVLVVVFLSRSISRPLVDGVSLAKRIADGDLSVSLNGKGRGDEVGQLAEALNQMVENLRSMVSQIRTHSEQLASSSEEVSASATQLASGAQAQASTLEETSAAVEELTASVEQVADHAQSQATAVERSSSNVQQMKQSVDQVVKTLTEVSTSSQESMSKAQSGAESVQKAVESIQAISASAEQIAGIINVISDIADQTNLLALNASIEAARAGEHGRGFAVVADEVSKLAERSASSTKEIEVLIKESGSNVRLGVEIAQAALASMEAIIAGARETNEVVTALAGDIEQQVSAIQEVFKATDTISEMSQSISAATEQQTSNAKQVAKAIENVNELTQAAASSAEQMSASTEELSSLSQQLQAMVQRFRVAESLNAAAKWLPEPAAQPDVEVSAVVLKRREPAEALAGPGT